MNYYCKADKKIHRKNGTFSHITYCNEVLQKEEKCYRCPRCNSIFSISYVEPRKYEIKEIK